MAIKVIIYVMFLLMVIVTLSVVFTLRYMVVKMKTMNENIETLYRGFKDHKKVLEKLMSDVPENQKFTENKLAELDRGLKTIERKYLGLYARTEI